MQGSCIYDVYIVIMNWIFLDFFLLGWQSEHLKDLVLYCAAKVCLSI